MASDLRAFAVALLLMVGGIFAFFETATLDGATATPSLLSLAIGYATPIVSGMVFALLAGIRRFGVLLCLGVAGAAAFTGVDRVWALSGFTLALGGISESEWLFGVSMITVPLLVMIGACIGVLLRHRLTQRVV